MFDSIASNDTLDSVLVDHSVYSPRAKVPGSFISVLLPLGRRTSDVCLHCPVQKLSICSALQGAELATLGNHFHTVRHSHKALLVDQGEWVDSLHIVTAGVVRLFKILQDGRRQVVGFALPGDLLGVAVDNYHAYSAEALGDVTSCQISRRVFDTLLDAMPHLLRRLHAAVVQDLSAAQDHMMLLGHYSARQKLAAFLLHMRNRWRRVNGVSAHVVLPMPRQDIADYLGLTIETVSRTISLLACQKIIIVVPDGVRIIDIERLTRAAGE